MRLVSFLAAFIVLSAVGFFPMSASAALPTLTYRYDHHLFSVNPNREAGWQSVRDVWLMGETEVRPPQELRVDGDLLPDAPPGLTRGIRTDWNHAAIVASIERIVAAKFDRAAGSVSIQKDASGSIIFDGVGLTGRSVNVEAAATLTIAALRAGVTDIELPVTETKPRVSVTDDLQAMGIREVVTVGESDFTGSPVNRRHNISVGLSKFNGHWIPQGTVFSFGETLGPVDGRTGYRKELVIKGDRTEPDYGGGLCQVSTTAYRGVWEYGFPIKQRINHSYAVGYYGPQGTDATVYPPNPDMKFLNDSPGALLMQTHIEGDKAYFIYYGTRDTRESSVLGPFITGTRAPPPDRQIFTTELPPGTRKKLGERHAGMRAVWYRFTKTQTGSLKTEPVVSIYEARPLFYEVGVEKLPEEPIVPAEEST